MEQIIVFLYDTGYCQHESDDPQKAVLYFHPKWVSEQQRLALCGQLMGATQFCSTIFSAPSVLTLQSGKFVIKKLGRYVLSVGSDQSLPEWILKERFRTLQSLLTFYHRDLENILESVGNCHDAFIERLSQIFEVYIPTLQKVVSSVGSIPSLQYSKGSSTVFLEAMQLLEACGNCEGVIGGAVLHNDRVISSQLDAESNLLVALTDPYRLKTCAEAIKMPFHLPVGVQLLKVFVQSSVLSALRLKPEKKQGEIGALKVPLNAAKRDFAKIFTVHEDEPWSSSQPADIVPAKESAYLKLKQRRNSRHKQENSNALKERSKNFKANPNISVCSTPTVEKKLIHEELLSICSGRVDSTTKLNAIVPPDLVQDVIKSNPSQNGNFQNSSLRRTSMDDQMVDLTHTAYPIPLRYYSFGLPKLYKPEEDKGKSLYRCKLYKTIADPMYPVFREDGVPVTKGLYKHRLDEHYKDYLAANLAIDSREKLLKKKNLEKLCFEADKTVPNDKSIPRVVERPKELHKSYSVTAEPKTVIEDKKPEPERKVDQKLFRRSLTLPLKPMSLDGLEEVSQPPMTKSKQLPAVTPSTPLLTKLSLLTFEEQLDIDSKPAEPPPAPTPRKKEEPRVKDVEKEKVVDETKTACSLFICGHRSTTLILLLNEKAEQNPDLVLNLWELGTNNLDRVENQWERSMDHVTQNNGGSSYSFLSLDPSWGTIRKYGPWGQEDLKVVGSLHQDLLTSNNITELIVRNEDSVVYGYRCGYIETFYQQGGCSSVGLPTPADLMGVVTLKARRRLERDHGVVLL